MNESKEQPVNDPSSDVAAPSEKIELEIPDDVVAREEGGNALDAQLQEAEQRVLRAQAELENFRRRSRRETEDQLKFANQDLMKDLLPVIDNLTRAISAASDNAEASGLLQGVQMVAQQMLDTLVRHGCERVDANGKPFDPNLHEAISQLPSDEYERGSIVQVVQDGYTLHGRVLRPAHVIVSSGPVDNEQQ